VDRSTLFKRLERGGAFLRRLGLGKLVDRARRLAERRMGRFEAAVDGLQLTGVVGLHLHYVDELVAGAREDQLTTLFKEGLEPGATVLDVGAHLGFMTLQAARAVGPQGHVFAVEPNPETLGLLHHNIAANGFADRVTVLPLALSDSEGEVVFHVAPSGDGSSLYAQDATRGQTRVRATTADAALADAAPLAAVKIDVEGAELRTLAGMEQTLRRALPDLRLFAECNPDALRRAGSSPTELLERLEELGFRVRVIDEASGRLLPPDDLEQVPGYVNLICDRAPR
jgi:FkbM family methyltransferase